MFEVPRDVVVIVVDIEFEGSGRSEGATSV
jgi:hypothetical protein